MALIGLILASFVNIFLQSAGLYWIISYVGVLVFVGLTAFDTQKIKQLAAQVIAESKWEKSSYFGCTYLVSRFYKHVHIYAQNNGQ